MICVGQWGGAMYDMNLKDVKVSTIFTRKLFHLKKIEKENIYKIVLDEDKAAMAMTGVKYEWADFEDAQLRGYKRLSAILGGEVVWEENIIKNDIIYNRMNEYMNSLNEMYMPEEVYVPLGIGNHIDHIIVRNIAVDVFQLSSIVFYEDMPYATNEKWYEAGIREFYTRFGGRQVKKYFADISKKMKLIECYDSQLMIRDKERMLKYQEDNKDENGYYEKFWVMDK